MFWGWKWHWYRNVPGWSNVNVTDWPGFMTIGAPGSPPSRNATEWLKLSLFVQVTVAPVSTTIAAGANLYDFGRSTVVVATGEAFARDELVQPPSRRSDRAAAAITAAARRAGPAGLTRAPRPRIARAPSAS